MRERILLTRQPEPRRWYRVAEVAEIFGMADMTLYRAIHAGEFPAVKIRGRYVIPARALEAMEEAAIATNALVDASDFVPTDGDEPPWVAPTR